MKILGQTSWKRRWIGLKCRLHVETHCNRNGIINRWNRSSNILINNGSIRRRFHTTRKQLNEWTCHVFLLPCSCYKDKTLQFINNTKQHTFSLMVDSILIILPLWIFSFFMIPFGIKHFPKVSTDSFFTSSIGYIHFSCMILLLNRFYSSSFRKKEICMR